MPDPYPGISSPPPGERAQRPGVRRRNRWAAAVVVAVVVHASGFLVLDVSSGRQEAQPGERSGARWLGELMADNIELINPEPLFLPTHWNASSTVNLDAELDAPDTIFGLVEPELSVPPGRSPPGLVVIPEGVRTAGVAIRRFARPYFSAFGRVDREREVLPRRAGLLEVQVAATGEVVLRREVSVAEAVAAGADPRAWPLWEPFELLLAVESTGALGVPLVPAPGSGAEAVDQFFRSSLRALLRPELVLPAGYYRVVVGP